MALYVFSLLMSLLSLAPPPACAQSPWSQAQGQADWWHGMGRGWEVSNTLRQRSIQYATFNQIFRQMAQYGPATHMGMINTGQLQHPHKYRPRDHAYGSGADFNQGELRKGVFKKVPDDGVRAGARKSLQTFSATKPDVLAGMAKCVGDTFLLPTLVTVMDDGSFTVETQEKQNPCAGNPCSKYGPFRISYCSKEENYIAKCDPRNEPFQVDLTWTSGGSSNLNIRVIVIDAATGEVERGLVTWRDEVSHRDEDGAYGAIIPDDAKGGPGTETLHLTTLSDSSDYKDYVYAITAHRTNNNGEELQDTGGSLEVSYDGAVVNTIAIPQGALANPPNRNGKYRRRFLFGCFKPGRDGHYLDTSVAMFEYGGMNGRARMAALCAPKPSELCL